MTTEEVAINLLCDHTCDNCDHQRAANKCAINASSRCYERTFIKCPEECTCLKWEKKRLDIIQFSIPKNPCGEVALSEYTVCCIEREHDK